LEHARARARWASASSARWVELFQCASQYLDGLLLGRGYEGRHFVNDFQQKAGFFALIDATLARKFFSDSYPRGIEKRPRAKSS
jgi:hypothetical protein